MCLLQPLADLASDAQRVFDRELVGVLLPYEVFESATRHVLGDDVGLAAPVWTTLVTYVEHSDDVLVVAQTAHGLRLAMHAGQAGLVYPLCLDEGDPHVS